MLKTIARLEHKIGEKVYHFLCDTDSPISEVKDAISQFMGHVVSVENAAKAQQPQPVAAPVDPVPAQDVAPVVATSEAPVAEQPTQG